MNDRAGGSATDTGRGRAIDGRAGLLRLLAALLLVNALFLLPDIVLLRARGAAWLAAEALLVGAAFALASRTRAWRIAAGAVAGACVAVFVLETAETVMWTALRRPLNLYLDVWLIDSVHHLLVGAVGPVPAVVVELLAAGALVGTGVLVARLLLPPAPEAGPASPSTGAPTRAALAVAAALGGAGLLVGAASLKTSLLDAPVARLARDQVVRYAETRRDRGVFRAELAEAPAGYADTPGLLAGLGGSDVILGFLESYGAAAIEDPRYADVVGPRLDALERRVSEAGLHVVSGRLVAPSQGGQSWFAHGSLLSGLWLDNQIRYDLMLGSGRETLIDDFRRAGYRTVALMPAIQLAWPEGVRFGYDEVWARSDIDYAGPPLNWVTMPDQFTWSFLETTIRAREPQRPLFAEVGLISSHAPWTPILDVIDDWSSIGDGSVFARWEGAGEPPQELWLDTERVREHYARSVGYAVDVAASYAARFVDDRTLLIVLGDHQPAPLITGDDAPWDVPVHVISGDPGLLEPFLDWGFVDGAWPPPYDGTTLGVDYFRDWFIRAYSGSPARVTRAGTTPQGGDGGSGGHPDG